MHKKTDMLHGPLIGRILLFALPIILGSVLQQIFSAVDLAVVGLTGDSIGQSAIGANTSLLQLFINTFVMMTSGINVVIGSYIGQERKERITDAVHTYMLFALIAGFILIFIILGISRPALILIDTPADTIDQAVLYLRIYALGMPFVLIYNFGAAILRSAGDSRRPLFALLGAGVFNVILDFLLTWKLRMGVAGVAIATVSAMAISATCVVIFLMREQEYLRLYPKKLHINLHQLGKFMRVGLPAALQAMVFSIANTCVQSGINVYGPNAIAGNAIALIFEILSFYIVTGFNQAAVTFTSQNYGAGNLDRCRKVFWVTMISALIGTGIANSTFILGRNFFVGFFTQDPLVADYVYRRFFTVLILQSMICSYEICASALRGYGHSISTAIITIFGTCILRVVWIKLVAVHLHQIEYVFIVYPLSWIVTGIAVIIAYIFITSKIKKRFISESSSSVVK